MGFQRYSETKSSEIDWLNEVPRHWSVVRLRRVAELNPSKAEVCDLDRELPVSFLPMEAVGDDGRIQLEHIRPIGAVENGYTYFREGDVTLAKITPCFENGKGAIMRGLLNGIGFGTTELIVIRPNPQHLTGNYLNWLFMSSYFRRIGESTMYGAGGQKRVSDHFVRNFATGIPPVEEQETIATFLDTETAKIDTLISEQRRLIELLKEKRQAVISHAVTKGLNPNVRMKDSGVKWLGEVPEHWGVSMISRVSIKITNGYVGPTRDILVEDGVPYIQATHIKRGRVNFDGAYFVRVDWSNKHAKSILELDDVLIVQTGAGTGDIGLVSENEVGFNCHALIIVQCIREKMFGPFLATILQSQYGTQTLESIQTGGMHPHLNCGNVKFVYVPVPPLDEQNAIVGYVSKCSQGFDALQAEAEKAISLLQERRTALISAAVTGKIDVRDYANKEAA